MKITPEVSSFHIQQLVKWLKRNNNNKKKLIISRNAVIQKKEGINDELKEGNQRTVNVQNDNWWEKVN